MMKKTPDANLAQSAGPAGQLPKHKNIFFADLAIQQCQNARMPECLLRPAKRPGPHARINNIDKLTVVV